MVNAPNVNNIAPESIPEIAAQNANNEHENQHLSNSGTSGKGSEADASSTGEETSGPGQGTSSSSEHEANQATSVDQLITYVKLDMKASAGTRTVEPSAENSDSIQTQDSNEAVIDREHRRPNCSPHNSPKKLKRGNQKTSNSAPAFKVTKTPNRNPPATRSRRTR